MTSDGEALYVAGMDFINGEGNQLLVLKLDFDLNLLWDRHWGENGGGHIHAGSYADAEYQQLCP